MLDMDYPTVDNDDYFPLKRRFQDNGASESDTNLMWRGLQLSKAKLKAVSQTSGLLSGFAVVAIIELEIDKDAPMYLKIPFVVCACILVAVHMIALMIATCILPNLEMYSQYKGLSILQSPHEKLRKYIEVAWICSTGIGILLFLVVAALACWLKFHKNRVIAIVASCILGPVMLIFVIFAGVFYNSLIGHKFRHAADMVKELDYIMDNLEDHGAADLKTVTVIS